MDEIRFFDVVYLTLSYAMRCRGQTMQENKRLLVRSDEKSVFFLNEVRKMTWNSSQNWSLPVNYYLFGWYHCMKRLAPIFFLNSEGK